ncbi:MAG: RNA methyltransferase [Burkholderiales bacterium]|nr:RNA methyltransferase [Burkholderiales bacterium]
MTERELLERCRVVLVRTSHPGNIGAAARAMHVMGLADLRLVAPARYPAPEARWMAASGVGVLERAQVHATLAEALAGCEAAFALSARPREWSPPVLGVREAAPVALARAAAGPVAFVFGPEASGLEQAEVFACQYLVHIPTWRAPGAINLGSLNLAQAVQIVAYELCVAAGASAPAALHAGRLATIEDLEGLYAHLERAAVSSGFLDPASNSKLRERWRRLFSRVALEREEVNILRGLLNALEKAARK